MAVLTRVMCAVAAWLVASVLVWLPVHAEQIAEHDVKAAYLYNFTRFVEWPAEVPPGSHPFRLCVVADEKITGAIQRTMSGESVNGRTAETVVPRSVHDVRSCQVLFVGRAQLVKAAPLLAAVRDHPVLTVSDAENFAGDGAAGTIGFVRQEGRVRFDVNLEAAKRSRLVISSRLLQVSRNYGEKRP